MRPHGARLACAAPQMGRDEQQSVVLQVAADTGQVGDDLDPERLQARRRPDAGAHQQGRRMDGTCA